MAENSPVVCNHSRSGQLTGLVGEYLVEKCLVLARPPAALAGSSGGCILEGLDLSDELLDACNHAVKIIIVYDKRIKWPIITSPVPYHPLTITIKLY